MMKTSSEPKLPKQWRHWCANQHLKPTGRGRRRWGWFYLKGRGRVWRVNDKGMFQRGDTYADFDRWALCSIIETPMPKTQAEFDRFIRFALDVS